MTSSFTLSNCSPPTASSATTIVSMPNSGSGSPAATSPGTDQLSEGTRASVLTCATTVLRQAPLLMCTLTKYKGIRPSWRKFIPFSTNRIRRMSRLLLYAPPCNDTNIYRPSQSANPVFIIIITSIIRSRSPNISVARF